MRKRGPHAHAIQRPALAVRRRLLERRAELVKALDHAAHQLLRIEMRNVPDRTGHIDYQVVSQHAQPEIIEEHQPHTALPGPSLARTSPTRTIPPLSSGAGHARPAQGDHRCRVLADTVADETLAPVTSVVRRACVLWLPIAVAVTGVSAVVYGAVQAGRSLRLVEEREAQIKLLTELVWVLTLGATGVAAIAVAAVL